MNLKRTKEECLKIWQLKDMGASQRQIAEVMGVSRGSIEKLLAAKDREAYIEKKFGGNPFMPKEGRELTPSEIKHKADAAPHPDIMGRHHGKLPDCVMILPDIQFPFAHPDIFPFLSMVAQRYKPDAIVGIGDEIDAYYLSAFEKDPNALNASHEYETALDQLDKLYKLFPKVLALHSNHGRGRLEKARVRGGLLRQMVVDYQTFINAPRGWGFYDEIILGDVVFMHGDGEAKLTRPYLERRVPAEFGRHLSVVHGHRHEDIGRQAQCVVGDKEYWAAYTGCLINPLAPAFGYTKARKAKLGCGIITHGEYKQIRLKLDDTRRWTNEL